MLANLLKIVGKIGDIGGVVRDMVHIHGQTYGCTRFTVYKDVREDRSARDVEPGGDQKPAGDCHRLDGCMLTGTPSLTMPAIAPATEAGDDLLETLRNSMYISPANKVHILVCFSWCKDTPWTTHGQVHGLGVFLVDIKGDSDAVFCDADFRLARQRQEISRCQIGKISFHRARKRSDIFLRDLETTSVAR